MPQPRSASRTLAWGSAAFISGLLVGWADLSATDVQGPLLLLMVSAFLLTLAGGRPAWLIGGLVALGLPGTHLIATLARGGHGPTWDILIAIIPGMLAAYAGFAVALVLHAGADAIRGRPASPAVPRSADAPQPGLSWRALLTVAVAGSALAGAIPVWATLSARAQPIAWWVALWWQVTTLVAWAALAPLLLTFGPARRRDETAGITVAALSRHLATVSGIAAAHALALPLLTAGLLVPLGPAGIQGATLWAFAAYLPMDALTYVSILTLAWASDTGRLARAAAERSAALSSDLARAELAALRAQIQPHFLFNALNAVAVLAKTGDARGAASATEKLAELLRHVLSAGTDGDGRVALGHETTFVERYLELERLRFGDRLRFSIEIEPAARDARVPALILQPIVENAVGHGIARRTGGRIAVRGWLAALPSGDCRLHVTVENQADGPSSALAPATLQSAGVGLSNVRSRLLVMYGADADLTLTTDAGGARAELTIPYAR